MNIVLTSDFPTTSEPLVTELISAGRVSPRIAWIPPFTYAGRERFRVALDQFARCGLTDLEFCDIDEKPDEEKLLRLHEYDIVYLTGGDPIAFRRNAIKVGLQARLQECLRAGCWVVGASGGAMQLTRNVSLYRLLDAPLDKVLLERESYEGMNLVDYELLPHANRFEGDFLDQVRKYSERVEHDVIALGDGGAIFHRPFGEYVCAGEARRFSGGVVTTIVPAA